jgi:hypothetical protein
MLNRFMLALVVFSGILMVLMMTLWAQSMHGASDYYVELPGAKLAVGWEDGSLRVGVLDRDDLRTPRFWWNRRSGLAWNDVGPGFDFRTNIWCWAVSIPFPAILFGLAIPPLWWFLVYRDRAEFNHRVQMGYCLNCGYDARESTGNRCSECGENPRQLAAPS